MEVQRIENFKIPNAVTHEITQEELQRDFDYYRAQTDTVYAIQLW